MKKIFFLFLFMLTFAMFGCSTKGLVRSDMIQYTIQAGAFSDFDNVQRFMDKLSQKGLDPYYYKDGNIYKVRFGNFYTQDAAIYTAEKLKEEGIINEYLIVSPDSYKITKNDNDLREKIVNTAFNYLGTPYIKGGNNEDGFDCSGFVQTVFRMNGIDLPRSSLDQYKRGYSIKDDLQRGDLVFFKINGRSISHVGIYIGDGKFIHAPRVGQKVRVESLELPYYKKRYVGAKTYLNDPDFTTASR
ncbi:NlpC/P60 family protein [Calditerrivibrio sp.]|uniref:NlpC/P60 family protein n=2 Tax=Calditerrivibrio sp. TaxID=2792612 RepID=UPI003D11ED35